MPNLRSTTKVKVQSVLDQTFFTRHEFEVKFPEADENGVMVEIKFISNPKYYYLIKKRNNTQTEECPGVYFSEPETYGRQNFTEALNGIATWVDRIVEDYKSNNPLYDEFADFRASIESRLKDHTEESDNHFSDGEKEAIKLKLDKIMQSYEELKHKNKLKEKELEEIRTEVAALKDSLQSFPKGLWFRSAGNKILRVISTYATSKEGRQLIMGATKNLLIGDNSDNP